MKRKRALYVLAGVLVLTMVAGAITWAQPARPRQPRPTSGEGREVGRRPRVEARQLSARQKVALLERFLSSLSREQRALLLVLTPPERKVRLVRFFARHPVSARPAAQARTRRGVGPVGPGRGEWAREALRARRAPERRRAAEAARRRAPERARQVSPEQRKRQAEQRRQPARRAATQTERDRRARAAAPEKRRPAAKRPAVPKKKPVVKKPVAKKKPVAVKKPSPQEVFKRADRNGDGKLTLQEALRAGLLKLTAPSPAVKKPARKEPTPPHQGVKQKRKPATGTRQQMQQRRRGQARKPATAGLAHRPKPAVSSARGMSREILENWDILKDLVPLEE